MRRLHSFLGLPPADRRLLIKAGLVVSAIRLGLWLMSFRALCGVLARAGIASRTAGSAPPERIAWAVAAASRYVPNASCLSQALAVKLLLDRSGHQAKLRMGVARAGERRLHAHAWVESEGRVVIGGYGLERYTTLPDLEGTAL